MLFSKYSWIESDAIDVGFFLDIDVEGDIPVLLLIQRRSGLSQRHGAMNAPIFSPKLLSMHRFMYQGRRPR